MKSRYIYKYTRDATYVILNNLYLYKLFINYIYFSTLLALIYKLFLLNLKYQHYLIH